MSTEFDDYEDDIPEDTYDPARRRRGGRFLFDPGRRRRRKGRMPAGLRRYWAARGRRFDPARRRHYGPWGVGARAFGRRRGRGRRRVRLPRWFDPGRYRRRHYDPGFGATGSWMNAVTSPLMVAAGSILHNFLVHGKGLGARTMNVPVIGANVTQTGAAAFAGSVLANRFNWGPEWLRGILNGMFAEGFNVPSAESISRTGPGGAVGAEMFPGGRAQAPVGQPSPADISYQPIWANF